MIYLYKDIYWKLLFLKLLLLRKIFKENLRSLGFIEVENKCWYYSFLLIWDTNNIFILNFQILQKYETNRFDLGQLRSQVTAIPCFLCIVI